ncbi:MAG: TolC family protein [Gemmatimonadaceae bacterium]
MPRCRLTTSIIACAFAAGSTLVAFPLHAQDIPPESAGLDRLVARTIAANPDFAAARSRALAMRARIAPAGARPDPMLMAGIINVPINNFSFSDDDMTMKMIGLSQTIPYPGKLRLARTIAELQAAETAVVADSIRLAVVRGVKNAYYEIAYIDAALEIASRTDTLAGTVIKAASLRYSAGPGNQQDVLRANIEASRLNVGANELIERRRALTEKIGALIADVPPSLTNAAIPARLVRAAVDSNVSAISFSSRTLGSSATAGPLFPLADLQAFAMTANPQIRRNYAANAIVAARMELAQRQHLPDFDFSLQYGQRSGTMRGAGDRPVGRPDMVSFVVSVPVPLQRASKQGALVAAARADIATGESEQRATEALVRSEVARVYSDVTRARTQLALYVKALLPQARASLASAVSGYRSGTSDLSSVLDSQRTLLDMEVGYHRSMTDFAQGIAELDAMTGQETLR